LKDLESEIENLSVVSIDKLVQKKFGKMNALAQLGEYARGEFLLFTDADTIVPKSWIKNMTNEYLLGKAIVIGTTSLDATNIFSRLQSMEWIHAIGIMKVMNDLNINVSSIGNNMGISKRAFDSVGGFRDIPFSITEDYEIFRQISNKGFSSFHIFESSVLATSIPSSSFLQLLIQRKRWMFGAFRLPVPMLLLLILDALYYPAVIVILLLNLYAGISILILRLILQGIFILLAFRKLDKKVFWGDIIFYELYAGVVNILALLVFILPIKIIWKGRNY
jgi:cellulose synthase/poly-beta-1,6-N-acetylglucosamine synthase-like glycosyltransferase